MSYASPPLVQVGFRCTPEVAVALNELAQQQGNSIRRLIVTWLAQAGPQFAEAARLDSERPDGRRRRSLQRAAQAPVERSKESPAQGEPPAGPVGQHAQGVAPAEDRDCRAVLRADDATLATRALSGRDGQLTAGTGASPAASVATPSAALPRLLARIGVAAMIESGES
jgi:hypothetical protein